jgi:hypothetical protein
MSKFLKVEGHKDYVRDQATGVILNINKSEMNLARERKRIRKEKEKELDNLKNEVSEIKQLLNRIIEKL